MANEIYEIGRRYSSAGLQYYDLVAQRNVTYSGEVGYLQFSYTMHKVNCAGKEPGYIEYYIETDHPNQANYLIYFVGRLGHVSGTTWRWYWRIFINGVQKYATSVTNEVLDDFKFIRLKYEFTLTDAGELDQFYVKGAIEQYDDPFMHVSDFKSGDQTTSWSVVSHLPSTVTCNAVFNDYVNHTTSLASGEYYLFYIGLFGSSLGGTYANLFTEELDWQMANSMLGAGLQPKTAYTMKDAFQRDYKTEIDQANLEISTVKANLATAKTEIDAIKADIQNGTYGLSPIKTTSDNSYNILNSGSYGLSHIVSAFLNNGTFGLSPIKDYLVSPTLGFPNVIDIITNIISDVRDVTFGLSPIKTKLDDIYNIVNHATYGNAMIKTDTGNVINHGTYGLVALQPQITSTKDKVTDPVSGVEAIYNWLVSTLGVIAGMTFATALTTIDNKIDNIQAYLDVATGALGSLVTDSNTEINDISDGFKAPTTGFWGPIVIAILNFVHQNTSIAVTEYWDLSQFTHDIVEAILGTNWSLTLPFTKTVWDFNEIVTLLAADKLFKPPKKFSLTIAGVVTWWYMFPYIPIPIPANIADIQIIESSDWTYEPGKSISTLFELMGDIGLVVAIIVGLYFVVTKAPQYAIAAGGVLIGLLKSYTNSRKFKDIMEYLEDIASEVGTDEFEGEGSLTLDEKVEEIRTKTPPYV